MEWIWVWLWRKICLRYHFFKKLKFSKNERFQAPLDVLINKGMEVTTFKAIIDLLMSKNFDAVEGYEEFNNFTKYGLDFFLSEYWELSSDNVDKYKGGLI